MTFKKFIKTFIDLFAFYKKNAGTFLAVSFLAALHVIAEDISDSDVLDAVSSTDLISNSDKLTLKQIPKATTDVHKVTTEVLYQQNGNVEYYYHEIYKQNTTNKIADISPPVIPRKVNIISDSEELPIPPPEQKKEKVPQIKEIYYVYAEDFNKDEFYKVPLLSDKIGVTDSIEPFNRAMFVVDDVLFVYLISPIGKGYKFIVPHHFRKGISRMDYNIEMPKRLFNNLFQAKWKGAGISFSRFLVNSTIGLAGFYDPAKEWFGWEKRNEDFGQSLALWGVPPGTYFYLPILGSHTLRGFGGSIVDLAMDPRNALIITPVYGVTVFMKFNNITLKIDAIEQLKESYYDTYSLKRDFWYMKRTADIAK